MVVIENPNKVCICIDPYDLNQAIKYQHYPAKAAEEMVAKQSMKFQGDHCTGWEKDLIDFDKKKKPICCLIDSYSKFTALSQLAERTSSISDYPYQITAGGVQHTAGSGYSLCTKLLL